MDTPVGLASGLGVGFPRPNLPVSSGADASFDATYFILSYFCSASF